MASPLARRLAAAQGIALDTLTGSGPNGRIVKADVEAAKPRAAQPDVPVAVAEPAPVAGTATAQPPASPATLTTDIPHESVKLSNIRKTIARRLTESKQTIPHIYLTVDIRLDALLKLRGELNATLEARGVKLSVNDMLIKALGAALMAVPKCNVSFAGDNMLQYSRADISVAVSIPNGLITPIITDAGSKSISAVATEMAALAVKAKEGKLSLDDLTGGTFSISNGGTFGSMLSTPIINPPQSAILGVHATKDRAVVENGQVVVRPINYLAMSYDHRIIDGREAVLGLVAMKEALEDPSRLLFDI